MKKIWTAALLAALLSVSALTGCSGAVEEATVDLPEGIVIEEEAGELEIIQEVEEKAEAALNPLTGEPVPKGETVSRPVSFIINNSVNAWPQCGISEADVVYEWPYEASATRIMAVFSDFTAAETIGPLRSARHDFVEMSMPLHTIFVHWGGSKPGYRWLSENAIEKVDGMTGYDCFFRDQARLDAGKALEHTAMVDTAKLEKQIGKLGYETEEAVTPAFLFNTEKEPIVLEDKMAENISIQISGDTLCELKYDPSIEKYTKYEYGRQQMDANNDAPVELDNILILYGRISSYDGENVWRDLKLEEGGDGYYVTRGTKMPITWSKDSKEDRFVYLKETGEELVVNTGKTWVIIAEYGAETSFGTAAE